MNLPDAPIAHEGFFAANFFAVMNQEKSKDFGGKAIKPEDPSFIKLGYLAHSQFRRWPDSRQAKDPS
jgi:hypothetical protein